MKPLWVKMPIRIIEWKNYYSYCSSYCFLKKDEEGVWIGFLIVGDILNLPQDCQLCMENELLQIDEYRRSRNIRPFPLPNEKK